MKVRFAIMCLVLAHAVFAAPSSSKNENGSFKISENSLKHMGIVFKTLYGDGPWEIPKSALVKIKFTSGVYRHYQNEISFVVVNIISHKTDTLMVGSVDLEGGDKIATGGTQFLRLAEADLNSDSVDSCSH